MEAKQGSSDNEHGGNGGREGQFHLTGMQRYADGNYPTEDPTKLSALHILAPEGLQETGTSSALSKVAPNEWTMKDSIQIPGGVDAIGCAIMSEGGENAGSVHMDGLRHTDDSRPNESNSKTIEGSDSTRPLCTSWGTVKMPSSEGAIKGAGDESVDQRTHLARGLHDELEATQTVVANSSGINAAQGTTVEGTREDSERIEKLDEIEEEIERQTSAILLSSQTCPNLAAQLSDLGSLFSRRFTLTGDLQDIAGSIAKHTSAVSLLPEDHADLTTYLTNLGSSFESRFGRTGDFKDLAEAISSHTRAVSLAPEGHPDLPTRLFNLGRLFLCRFELTGNLQDAAESISRYTGALHLTPEGHPDLPLCLSSLGNSFSSRFGYTGDFQDIAESISKHTAAIDLTPEGHADLPIYLSNLGDAFLHRFERTGDLQDVAEAISRQSRAVHLTPEGHPDLPLRLSNLGTSFSGRFERTDDLQDIVGAIENHTRAVRLTPEGHTHLPIRLSELASSFACRFEQTGDLQDIAEAISRLNTAVRLTPEGHAQLFIYISNVGDLLMSRFNRTGDFQDLSEAISKFNMAVDLTPEGRTDLPDRLAYLGDLFLRRFEHTGDLQDISEAISRHTRALHLTPEGHYDQPHRLSQLGDIFLRRFKSSNLPEHLDESISSYELAAISVSGNPFIKVDAASRWASLLDEHKPQSAEVLTAFNVAIRLLALSAGLQHSVQLRHAILQNRPHLPLLAAGTAFRLKKSDKALEWLEQGRCLVWSQQNQLRTPVDELRVYDAALADQVKSVASQLQNIATSPSTGHVGLTISERVSREEEADNCLRLVREWEDLLKSVRKIPPFISFLQPVPYTTIMECLPESGPVIVINIQVKRCDAIALLAGVDKPLHIPLPLFSLEKATRHRRALGNHLQDAGLRQRGEEAINTRAAGCASERALRPPGYRAQKVVAGLGSVLESLWKEVVKPILDTLKISKADPKSSARLPKIWWCPTGPISFLPLHAAGVYRTSEVESVMDYVVSSYTPTVMALGQRVNGAPPIDSEVSGLFLTCQPNAPGANSIAGTKREVTLIHEQAVLRGVRSMKLEGNAVTTEGCLELMEKFSSIHLACHASQNAAEPLNSRFLFHTGSLNLGKIMQRDLKNADLAFLSACETSTGEEKLSDEAVHLAAGMLAAGYRRVVATMWRIGDEHAPKISNDFYQHLWAHREEGSGARFDGTLSAYALHHAAQNLRKRLGSGESSLLAWVPFVHFGY